MKVPFIDLSLQYEKIKPQVEKAVHSVLDTQNYILGSEVEKLEKDISQYCRASYGLGVSSGTDALLLALMAINLQPGDEVITTSLSFVATAEVISFLKAKPVFVDIDPDSYCMDPKQIEAAITPKTKAIIPVHIFGQCADIDSILDIARHHNLVVIEDACQAIGAINKGRLAGGIADMGCFSFYPSKNLGAAGDAGMLVTNNEKYFTAAREYRTHGEYPKAFQHKKIGINARIDAIQAAILNVKFPLLDDWNQKRRQRAQTYYKLFEEANLLDKIALPKVARFNKHVFHLYSILSDHKEQLRNYLIENNIFAGNHFPKPLPFLDCYQSMQFKKGDFPVAENFCEKSIALPIYPELKLAQQTYIVEKIKSFYETK